MAIRGVSKRLNERGEDAGSDRLFGFEFRQNVGRVLGWNEAVGSRRTLRPVDDIVFGAFERRNEALAFCVGPPGTGTMHE